MRLTEREVLEQRKLALEIAELRKRWFQKSGNILTLFTIAATVIGVVFAFYSGLFDVKKEKLEKQKAILELDVKTFELKKDTLNKQIDSLRFQKDSLSKTIEMLINERKNTQNSINLLSLQYKNESEKVKGLLHQNSNLSNKIFIKTDSLNKIKSQLLFLVSESNRNAVDINGLMRTNNALKQQLYYQQLEIEKLKNINKNN